MTDGAAIITSGTDTSATRTSGGAMGVGLCGEEDQVDEAHVPVDSRGHLVKGTRVRGKEELARLMDRWLDVSTAATVGDVGSFGRTPWVTVDLGRATVVLHADTKRTAVKEYVEDVRRRSADVTWYVVANRRGNLNKVLFREDKQETPGWYCYVTRPFTAPGEL